MLTNLDQKTLLEVTNHRNKKERTKSVRFCLFTTAMGCLLLLLGLVMGLTLGAVLYCSGGPEKLWVDITEGGLCVVYCGVKPTFTLLQREGSLMNATCSSTECVLPGVMNENTTLDRTQNSTLNRTRRYAEWASVMFPSYAELARKEHSRPWFTQNATAKPAFLHDRTSTKTTNATTTVPPNSTTTGNSTNSHRRRRAITVTSMTEQALNYITVKHVPHPMEPLYSLYEHTMSLEDEGMKSLVNFMHESAQDITGSFNPFDTLSFICNPVWHAPCVVSGIRLHSRSTTHSWENWMQAFTREGYKGIVAWISMDPSNPPTPIEIEELERTAFIQIGECFKGDLSGMTVLDCKTGRVIRRLNVYTQPRLVDTFRQLDNNPWGIDNILGSSGEGDKDGGTWGILPDSDAPDSTDYAKILRATKIHDMMRQWDQAVSTEFSVESLLAYTRPTSTSLTPYSLSQRAKRAIKRITCRGFAVWVYAQTYCDIPDYAAEINSVKQGVQEGFRQVYGKINVVKAEINDVILKNYNSLRDAMAQNNEALEGAIKNSHNILKQALEEQADLTAEKFAATIAFIEETAESLSLVQEEQGKALELLTLETDAALKQLDRKTYGMKKVQALMILDNSMTAASVKLMQIAGVFRYMSEVVSTIASESPFDLPVVAPPPGFSHDSFYFAGKDGAALKILEVRPKGQGKMAKAVEIRTLVPGIDEVGPYTTDSVQFIVDEGTLYMELYPDTMLSKKQLIKPGRTGSLLFAVPIPAGIVVPDHSGVFFSSRTALSNPLASGAFLSGDNGRCYASCVNPDGCPVFSDNHSVQKEIPFKSVTDDCSISQLRYVLMPTKQVGNVVSIQNFDPIFAIVSVSRKAISPLTLVNSSQALEDFRKKQEALKEQLQAVLTLKTSDVDQLDPINLVTPGPAGQLNLDAIAPNPIEFFGTGAFDIDLTFLNVTAVFYWITLSVFLGIFGFKGICKIKKYIERAGPRDKQLTRLTRKMGLQTGVMKPRDLRSGEYKLLNNDSDTEPDHEDDEQEVLIQTSSGKFPSVMRSKGDHNLIDLINPATGKISAVKMAVDAGKTLLTNTAKGKHTQVTFDPRNLTASIQ